MDRRVKERLVGASILVVLIVLIVPELLSGPASAPEAARLPVSAPEPVRNVTVDLATARAPESGMDLASAPSLQRSSTTSPDAPPGVQPPLPGVQPPQRAPAAGMAAEAPVLPAESAPRAAAPSLETASPPPTSATAASKPAVGRGWAVQLGSFASRDNADKMVHQMKGQGFAVYVLSSGSGGSQRHRVRIGPLADRGAASQVVTKLKSMGQPASIVAPGA